MGILFSENWYNIRRTGRGAVGRTTRERERAEFGLILFEEKNRAGSSGESIKTRTLKTEGCGTPLTSSASGPATRLQAKLDTSNRNPVTRTLVQHPNDQ